MDSLYTESPKGRYWYENGINKKSIYALLIAGFAAIFTTFVVTELANYALFIGGIVAAISYRFLMEPERVELRTLKPVKQN